MWTCPQCDRSFANAHQWHSCLRMALDEHLAAKSDHAVALYRAVEAALANCGRFRIHPQKTRIAFITRMTFAGVALAQRWVDVTLILPTAVSHDRVRRIELYGPTSFAHSVRLASVADLDAEVRRWLCDAHRRGGQETLDPDAHVEPVVGSALETLKVPVRSKVIDGALAVPRYAAEALEAAPGVRARIAGETYTGSLSGGAVRLDEVNLGSLGLGEGDEADVFLSADL